MDAPTDKRPSRLLNASTLKLEKLEHPIPPYAILSHTWEEDEVTYQEWKSGQIRQTAKPDVIDPSVEHDGENARRAGYAKVEGACAQALEDQLQYIWVDSCCINNEDLVELSEAINSMYAWYNNADVCYAYLSDVRGMATWRTDSPSQKGPGDDHPAWEDAVQGELRRSRWFTRGWTLQELLAPRKVSFFTDDWTTLDGLEGLWEIISNITNIPEAVLRHDKSVSECAVAQRISWASNRKTRRLEDKTYSLYGLLGVSLGANYGEGREAFLRLQQAMLMKSHSDLSILAWSPSKQSHARSLLAESPEDFELCGDIETNASVHRRSTFWPANGAVTGAFFMSDHRERRDGEMLALLGCYRKNKPCDILALRLIRSRGNFVDDEDTFSVGAHDGAPAGLLASRLAIVAKAASVSHRKGITILYSTFVTADNTGHPSTAHISTVEAPQTPMQNVVSLIMRLRRAIFTGQTGEARTSAENSPASSTKIDATPATKNGPPPQAPSTVGVEHTRPTKVQQQSSPTTPRLEVTQPQLPTAGKPMLNEAEPDLGRRPAASSMPRLGVRYTDRETGEVFQYQERGGLLVRVFENGRKPVVAKSLQPGSLQADNQQRRTASTQQLPVRVPSSDFSSSNSDDTTEERRYLPVTPTPASALASSWPRTVLGARDNAITESRVEVLRFQELGNGRREFTMRDPRVHVETDWSIAPQTSGLRHSLKQVMQKTVLASRGGIDVEGASLSNLRSRTGRPGDALGHVIEVALVHIPDRFFDVSATRRPPSIEVAAQTAVERFVVVEPASRAGGVFAACAIKTYGGQGVTGTDRLGRPITKANHAVIYSTQPIRPPAPYPTDTERQLRRLPSGQMEQPLQAALPVQELDRARPLDPMSRLDYSDVYHFVSDNVELRLYGRVDPEHVRSMEWTYRSIQHGSLSTITPSEQPPSTSSTRAPEVAQQHGHAKVAPEHEVKRAAIESSQVLQPDVVAAYVNHLRMVAGNGRLATPPTLTPIQVSGLAANPQARKVWFGQVHRALGM